MATVAKRLAALGLVLPGAVQAPPGVALPFQFVRVLGTRAFISGHRPMNADGSIAAPRGAGCSAWSTRRRASTGSRA